MTNINFNRIFSCLLAFLLVSITSCSYTFQNSRNPIEKIGIKKVYVETFRNLTYRPGIEQFFANALVREIKKYNSLKLVRSREEADAVIVGVINSTSSDPSGTKETGRRKIEIPLKLNSSVSCSISLIDNDGKVVFAYTASGGKSHVAAGVLSDKVAQTAHLINNSEERLAYQELAIQLMADTYQRLVDVF